MNEVKKPKRPMIFYYAVVAAVLLVFNVLVSPMLFGVKVTDVDYGEFMRLAENRLIEEVEIQDNQIIFSDKDNRYYRTGRMEDAGLTQRLYDCGAKFESEIIEEPSLLLTFLVSWVLPIVVFVALGRYFSKKMMEYPRRLKEKG